MAFQGLGRLVVIGGGISLSVYGMTQICVDKPKSVFAAEIQNQRPQTPLPTRAEQLKKLQETEFDVLVIGGGATGSGVALDAVSRGFETALVELDDISSGTSSRSTKLIHGGVRYLQKAFMNLDLEQYRMVKEALHERANLLAIAPHLSYPLPIMLPIYKWWELPYYWMGIKMYDLVAGRQKGQHNDARMNIAIAITAARLGATVANHAMVTGLTKMKNENGIERINGAIVKDLLSGKEYEIKAKCVINATGPFTDSVRKMDDPSIQNICQPSVGVHIVLPDYYSPDKMGLLDPSTSDGRVIFFLPWQKTTIAGTTDRACEVTLHPSPTEEDIQFILREIKNYLSGDIEVRRGDVLSAWAGIRPLVLDPKKENTESIARNHVIHSSDSGLVTIGGGKWTTYRVMAKETVDAAIKACNLKPKYNCQTDGLLLEGAHGWSPTMFIRLVQDFGLENEVAQHLANTYGDRAFTVAKMANLTGKRWPIVGRRLHEEFPYIEAEVRYALREYACTAVDVIARRLRLAFLNVQAAEEALPKIISIMAEELQWNKSEQKHQHELALEFLQKEMGQQVNKASRQVAPINFTGEEIKMYIKQFQSIDKEKKGFISVNDLRRTLKSSGEKIPEDTLHEILNEVDLNKNGQVELEEYLELMCSIKTGSVTQSRLAKAVEIEYQHSLQVPVERSGGGV
ncbi:glycerophosphate oxidase 1 isoform X2 [Tachypleus tridentatus]|uniref:glycerophosphate oxidase 1 isoform X2 n=1 Tax=Tachypleus tridentatus TaxID=6853 RepID=UPI003FD69F4B